MEHHELNDRLQQLKDKFNAMGQNLDAYLEGLIYADYLTYWDYIHLDTLLSLQKPKTQFKDEQIFIMYHQITELYFKLILHEINQLLSEPFDFIVTMAKYKRIIAYVKHLVSSFDIMVDGMDKAQFLKFRMALLPASGFQSAQIREIELKSTQLVQLCKNSEATEIESLYEAIYWKRGATELSSKQKTLTLKQFELKYDTHFLSIAKTHRDSNLWSLYTQNAGTLNEPEKAAFEDVMRQYDELLNVHWCLMHYKSAVRYLQNDPESIAATGGTNWQKYLPPMYQKITFFPALWKSKDLEEWGKKWVYKEILKLED